MVCSIFVVCVWELFTVQRGINCKVCSWVSVIDYSCSWINMRLKRAQWKLIDLKTTMLPIISTYWDIYCWIEKETWKWKFRVLKSRTRDLKSRTRASADRIYWVGPEIIIFGPTEIGPRKIFILQISRKYIVWTKVILVIGKQLINIYIG